MQVEIPSHETIRVWAQRVGLGRMRSARKYSGGTWLVDHSIQIGKEKALVIMRLRGRFRPGVPLRHQDVEILAEIPGTEWKTKDVAKAYQETAEQFGMPGTIITDGADELQDAAEALEKEGKKPRILRDLKHFLANRFESLLKKDEAYATFTEKLGWSRSALQQTELAHFIPPIFKVKARFMNMAPTLEWTSRILWHLEHPESESRKHVTVERMEEKLGWLREFKTEFSKWRECQAVISTSLTFFNKQGIYPGVVKEYQKLMKDVAKHPVSRQLVSDTIAFVSAYEAQLKPNERLPISTEILESSFALYKNLEKQHSKSGFTSLLLAFPTLLYETTITEVNACFATVKVADVKQWAKKNLPHTLAAKRRLMHREARANPKTKTNPKLKPRTKKRATPLQNAA